MLPPLSVAASLCVVRWPFFKRNIGMGEADPDKEGHHARDGFEFADLDVVVSRSGTGRDQELFHARRQRRRA